MNCPYRVETGSLKPSQTRHLLEMKFVDLAIISLLRQTLRVGVGEASACAEALPWHYDAATPTPNLWVMDSLKRGNKSNTIKNIIQLLISN